MYSRSISIVFGIRGILRLLRPLPDKDIYGAFSSTTSFFLREISKLFMRSVIVDASKRTNVKINSTEAKNAATMLPDTIEGS